MKNAYRILLRAKNVLNVNHCECINNGIKKSVVTTSLTNNYFTETSKFVNSYDSKDKTTYTKDWTKLLEKAERIVGYAPSFLSLRYLVSDEVAHFASLLRKLMLTNHPLIDIVKRVINEPDRYTQIIGIVVLLVSKASGIPQKNLYVSDEITDGIHKTQRSLAEITQMINMASIIHNSILDMKLVEKDGPQTDMYNGNKIAILCGDFLLAKACAHLAKLNNTRVVDMMSEVISDISQSIFIEPELNSDKSFLNCWYSRLYSNSTSLLANSCKSALMLVDQTSELQENVWEFGKNLDIAHKIWYEINNYKRTNSKEFPKNTLLYAIYRDKYDQTENNNLLDNSKLVNDVLNDSLFLFNKHYNISLRHLNLLNNNNSKKDALNSLESMLAIMKNGIII